MNVTFPSVRPNIIAIAECHWITVTRLTNTLRPPQATLSWCSAAGRSGHRPRPQPLASRRCRISGALQPPGPAQTAAPSAGQPRAPASHEPRAPG